MGELGVVVHVLGTCLAASWATYGMEAATGLHPMVRRGAQVGLCALAAWYIARVIGVQ